MSEEKKSVAKKTTTKKTTAKKTTSKKTNAKKVKKKELVEETPKVEAVAEAPAVEENPVAEEVAEAPAVEETPVEEEKAPVNAERMTSLEEDKDFDWEIYEMGSVEYTDDVRKELEKDYETALSTIDSEQVLDGSVVSITDREVIVNINYKSDGVILSLIHI